jgi:hypothetical protein
MAQGFAEGRLHRGRVVTEGGKLLIRGLLLGQRVMLYRVDHHFGQRMHGKQVISCQLDDSSQ